MDEEFRRFRCWDTARVQRTVFGDIAGLGLAADPVFLAAHTPMRVVQLAGPQYVESTDERTVAKALAATFGVTSENTVMAITGPSGTGKSHLVRWLRANLEDDSRRKIVYVPREYRTLRDLLARVVEAIPGPKADDVMQQFDKAVTNVEPKKLAEQLLDGVRRTIAFDLPEVTSKPDEDAAIRRLLLGSNRGDGLGGRQGGLPSLLLNEALRVHLLRPNGALDRTVVSLGAPREGRDERLPEFTGDDIPNQAGIRATLTRELGLMFEMIKHGAGRAGALRILNEAMPRAVNDTVFPRSGVTIGDLFGEFRQELRRSGTELVLLFEDLAQFGLVDGQLFEQFALQPGDRYAPLRVVFAITDAKFEENVPETVKTRLTHRYEVLELDPGAVEEYAVGFVARYLNIARLGREALLSTWHESSLTERESGSWIPNACTGVGGRAPCRHQETCWATFGQAGGVGLYPYNRTALGRAFRRPGPPMNQRQLVQEAVHDFLIEADLSIEAGTFPSDEVAKRRFDFKLSLPKDVVVPPQEGLTEAQRDRLHRVRVIWTDGVQEPESLRVAFDLATATGELRAEPPDRSGRKGGGEPPVMPPRPRPLDPLVAWENGERLPERDAVLYRELLHRLVRQRLDLGSLLVNPSGARVKRLVDAVLAPNSFELANAVGHAAGSGRLRFPIESDGPGVLLLSAARWFADHSHWDTEDPERRWDFVGDPLAGQVALDEFLDRCAAQVEAVIASQLLTGPIDPAAAVVALRALALLVTGTAPSPSGTTIDWASGDAGGPVGRDGRGGPWGQVVELARRVLAELPSDWITDFAAARQGDTGAPQVVDAVRLVPVVDAILADPLAVLSRATFAGGFDEIGNLWRALTSALPAGVVAESSNLRRLLETIDVLLGDQPIETTVGEAQSAGQLAGDHGVFRPTDRFADFRAACERLRDLTSGDAAVWLGAATGLTESNVPAVLAAQSWAARARSTAIDLQLVAECLDRTGDEIDQRLEERVGVQPTALVDDLTTAMVDTMTLLQRLDRGDTR